MPGCISNEILQNVPNYTQFNSTRYTKLYKSYNFQLKHLELINLTVFSNLRWRSTQRWSWRHNLIVSLITLNSLQWLKEDLKSCSLSLNCFIPSCQQNVKLIARRWNSLMLLDSSPGTSPSLSQLKTVTKCG